jgi:predicted small integral membrane protein
MNLEWMYWTKPTAIFFSTIFLMIVGMLSGNWCRPPSNAGVSSWFRPPGVPGFLSACWGTAYIHLAWLGLTDLNLWLALPIVISNTIRTCCLSRAVTAFTTAIAVR